MVFLTDIAPIATISEPVRNVQQAVGTSSILIAEVRLSTAPRRDILVRNISAGVSVITVNLGMQQAAANTGIILNPGESFSFSTEQTNPCPQCQFTAISSDASGLVSIMER